MDKKIEDEDDGIVVDLKDKNDQEEVKKLPKDEQDKIKVLSAKLRKELGINDQVEQKKDIAELVEEKKAAEEQKEPADIYSGFMKKYSKKEDMENSSFGKYDSDLDFKINRKIKRVFLPLPKKTKILLSAAAGVLAVGMIAAVAVALYKPPVPITLSSIAISQPLDNKFYYVENAYVGDKVRFDNIYLNCTYSDGKTKKVEILPSMTTLVSTDVVSQNKFVKVGNADYKISYGGKELNLRFKVKSNNPQSLLAFTSNFSSEGNNRINAVKSEDTIDLADKLDLSVRYENGEIKKIDIAECDYKIENGVRKKLTVEEIIDPTTGKVVQTKKKLYYGGISYGNRELTIYYSGTDSSGNPIELQCTVWLYIEE